MYSHASISTDEPLSLEAILAGTSPEVDENKQSIIVPLSQLLLNPDTIKSELKESGYNVSVITGTGLKISPKATDENSVTCFKQYVTQHIASKTPAQTFGI